MKSSNIVKQYNYRTWKFSGVEDFNCYLVTTRKCKAKCKWELSMKVLWRHERAQHIFTLQPIMENISMFPIAYLKTLHEILSSKLICAFNEWVSTVLHTYCIALFMYSSWYLFFILFKQIKNMFSCIFYDFYLFDFLCKALLIIIVHEINLFSQHHNEVNTGWILNHFCPSFSKD